MIESELDILQELVVERVLRDKYKTKVGAKEMLEEQEFEDEFYKEQIKMMEERYSKHFLKCKFRFKYKERVYNKASWKKYKEYICEKLKNNQYWIWVYYCGFEKFLQETKEPSCKKLEADANERIARIIGDFYKVQSYVKSL